MNPELSTTYARMAVAHPLETAIRRMAIRLVAATAEFAAARHDNPDYIRLCRRQVRRQQALHRLVSALSKVATSTDAELRRRTSGGGAGQ